MRQKKKARGPGCLAFGKGLRHSLAFVHTLHRRCVINQEPVSKVSSQLALDYDQSKGVVRLLKAISFIPSFERLAVIAQRDPGFDDDDIGEMFGTTAEWSAAVRERADTLRAREHIPSQYEVLTNLDFMGDEAARVAQEIKESRPLAGRQMESNRLGNIKSYRWRPCSASFIQAGIE